MKGKGALTLLLPRGENMKRTKALAVRQPKPENYQIPQTVTSPVERREIRQYMEMRQRQIKSRLDSIYRTNKEAYVEERYMQETGKLLNNRKLAELIKEYNKDNNTIAELAANRDKIHKQIERLCDRKQQVSEKIQDYADNTEGISYRTERYGKLTERHETKCIEPEDLLEESAIKDKLKEAFDSMNAKQMEERNRRLAYLNEKIEERLLFGKRDEIQKLFCELEKMNAVVEREMISLGLEQPSEEWIQDTDGAEMAEAA
jgi:chromosome segregation ATPase